MFSAGVYVNVPAALIAGGTENKPGFVLFVITKVPV
jgi:hypothetical protein